MATPRAHRIFRTLAAASAAALLAGCASAPISSARQDFFQGQFARAEETLVKDASKVQPKDRVLHLMERGTVRQVRGHYEESAADFIAAADRIHELDTYSVSKGAASLVVNDTVQDYRGAPYERTMLHVMTALDHFAVTNWDNAAVESRRIIESLTPTIRGDFPEDAFSRYVAGFGLEMIDDTSNAALQYRKAAALVPYLAVDDQSGRIAFRPYPAVTNAAPVPPPAPAATNIQVAATAQPSAVATTNAPKAAPAPAPLPGPMPVPRPPAPKEWTHELVCFALLDRGPSEYDGLSGDWRMTSAPGYIEIWIGGQRAGRSYPLANVGSLARVTAERQAMLKAAKTATRVVLKEVIAESVAQSTDNAALGDLIRFVLITLLEKPDVRRWETLPGSLQVARVPCPPGLKEYEVVLRTAGGVQLARTSVGEPIAGRRRTYVTMFRELPMRR